MENILKKKSEPKPNEIPNFDHTKNSVEEAIGVKGLVDRVSKKVKKLEEAAMESSMSGFVEEIYNGFDKLEMSFIIMNLLRVSKQKEGSKVKE